MLFIGIVKWMKADIRYHIYTRYEHEKLEFTGDVRLHA